jgi:hypothetical protein
VEAPLALLINLVERDPRLLSPRIGFLKFFLGGLSGIEELLNVYVFWYRELIRLEHDVSLLPPPSAQPLPPPEAPVESPPPSPSLADLFIIGASTSAGSEKNTGGDGIAVEEKLVVEGVKKRGKALKGVGILDGA